MADGTAPRAHLIGINHVALEVGSIEEALEFYRTVFEFDLRGRTESKAFLDLGDQFLALAETEPAVGRTDNQRHVGLVVDDPDTVERRIEELDVDLLPTDGLDFVDPWGNRIQVVAYEEIQFRKAEPILDAMEVGELEKSEAAIAELGEKGLAPE